MQWSVSYCLPPEALASTSRSRRRSGRRVHALPADRCVVALTHRGLPLGVGQRAAGPGAAAPPGRQPHKRGRWPDSNTHLDGSARSAGRIRRRSVQAIAKVSAARPGGVPRRSDAWERDSKRVAARSASKRQFGCASPRSASRCRCDNSQLIGSASCQWRVGGRLMWLPGGATSSQRASPFAPKRSSERTS